MRDENLCCLCAKCVDSSTADVLTMGNWGNPRYLCQECAKNIECATGSAEPEKIKAAISVLADLLPQAAEQDSAVFKAMNPLLTEAVGRLEKIEAGTYDFSLDSCESVDELDDIPEDMRETEEDKLLDERDEKAQKKLDKIFNIITLAVIFGAFAAMLIIRLIFK